MLWPAALTTFLLLVCQLSTGVHGDVIKRFRRGDTVDRVMRRYAEAMVEERIERRQSSAAPQMNATMWNEQTEAACITALMMLNGVASNPAGVGGVLGGAATVRLEKGNQQQMKVCMKRRGPAQEEKSWAAVNYVSFSTETKHTQAKMKKRK